jgi:hypothetical protein
MVNIQPNKKNIVKKAEKRLKNHRSNLETADQLTAGQRDALFVAVLQDLVRIELFRLGRLEDIE